MNRYRIVDAGGNPAPRENVLHVRSILHFDHVEMVNVSLIAQPSGRYDADFRKFFVIVPRVTAARFVPSLQMAELDVEDRGLYGVQPAVTRLDEMFVLLALAEIAHEAQLVGQTRIAGHDRTAITVRAQILARIKTKASGVAEASDYLTVPARPVRLAGVFDHSQVVALRTAQDRLHRDGLPVEMHGHDRFRVRRHGLLEQRRVEEVSFVHFDEDRFRAGRRHGDGRSDVGVRGDDHFVARPDAKGLHRELQSRGSGLDTHAIRSAHVAREVFFEMAYVGSKNEAAVLHHAHDTRYDLLMQRRELRLQIDERNLRAYHLGARFVGSRGTAFNKQRTHTI